MSTAAITRVDKGTAMALVTRPSKAYVHVHPMTRLRVAAAEAKGVAEDLELRSLALAFEAAKVPWEQYFHVEGGYFGHAREELEEEFAETDRAFTRAKFKLADAITRRGGLAAIANGKLYILVKALDHDCGWDEQIVVRMDLDRIATDLPVFGPKDAASPTEFISGIRKNGSLAAIVGGKLYILVEAFEETAFGDAEKLTTMGVGVVVG